MNHIIICSFKYHPGLVKEFSLLAYLFKKNNVDVDFLVDSSYLEYFQNVDIQGIDIVAAPSINKRYSFFGWFNKFLLQFTDLSFYTNHHLIDLFL